MREEGSLLGKPREMPELQARGLTTSAAGDEFLLLISFAEVFEKVDEGSKCSVFAP